MKGNRIVALKQRLFQMQNLQKKEKREVSIPISRYVGNVTGKTGSFEDMVKVSLLLKAGKADQVHQLYR